MKKNSKMPHFSPGRNDAYRKAMSAYQDWQKNYGYGVSDSSTDSDSDDNEKDRDQGKAIYSYM